MLIRETLFSEHSSKPDCVTLWCDDVIMKQKGRRFIITHWIEFAAPAVQRQGQVNSWHNSAEVTPRLHLDSFLF